MQAVHIPCGLNISLDNLILIQASDLVDAKAGVAKRCQMCGQSHVGCKF